MPRSRTLVVSAVAYTALFLAGSLLPRLPEGAYSDREVVDLLAEPDSRTAIVAAGLLLTLAGLALLPFLSALTTGLRRADGTSSLPTLVMAAGVLHVAMLLVAARFFSGYATGVMVGEVPVPSDPTLFRVLSDHGFGTLLVPGLMAAGLMMAATSLVGRRTGVLPAWVCTTGLALAALTLAGVLWLPQYLPPLWALIVAFTLRDGTGEGPASELIGGSAVGSRSA